MPEDQSCSTHSRTPEQISELRDRLFIEGRKIEHGTAHKLHLAYLDTILGTLEYFGADNKVLKLCYFDLKIAKYKIWDWLSMALGGRYGQELIPTFATLADLYIQQKNIGGWAQFLAGHDLECEEPYFCQDCIDTYNEVVASWEDPQSGRES